MSNIETIRFLILLSASNPTAAEILTHFASRKRNRQVERVRRLLQICSKGTKRQAVISVLRQLEARGFGNLVVGRRTYESRFVWGEV
jgi:hypothetical protein